MSHILVVEDSPTQAREIQLMLEDAGFAVNTAANGREALRAIAQDVPDLVLTDLQMPEMDGLELVENVRLKHPSVPVILMTAYGSEKIAIQALQRGAASYVPKKNLDRDLAETVVTVLEVSKADRNHQRLVECLEQTESHFLLENDASLIPPLIGHLEGNLMRMKLCDGTGLIRISVALREAVLNAIQHGNLEVSSEMRDPDEKRFYDLVEERRRQEPYKDRRVHVVAKESRNQAVYVIRDEGPGFDPSKLPDPTDPANLEKVAGRGLLLIRTFMDQVSHNEIGNEITLVKYRDA